MGIRKVQDSQERDIQESPRRRFVFSEVSFLSVWWEHTQQKGAVRKMERNECVCEGECLCVDVSDVNLVFSEIYDRQIPPRHLFSSTGNRRQVFSLSLSLSPSFSLSFSIVHTLPH